MTLLKMKKENLITVAGVVWLLAGVNVALIGVRSAVEMSGAAVGVVVALVVGAVLAFLPSTQCSAQSSLRMPRGSEAWTVNA